MAGKVLMEATLRSTRITLLLISLLLTISGCKKDDVITSSAEEYIIPQRIQNVLISQDRNDPQEIANGIKPVFNNFSNWWLPVIKQNMSSIWSEGPSLNGMNYYTMAKPKVSTPGYVQRTDYKSKYYQAWFGTYIIKGGRDYFGLNSLQPDLNVLASLGELDQKAWLKTMGDTNPQASFVSFEEYKESTVKIYGGQCNLYILTMNSHSDLNNLNNSLSYVFGNPDESYWGKELDAFHPIILKGFYCLYYDADHDVTVIIYANGCEFITKSNMKYETFSQLKDEFLEMIGKVSLSEVK